MFDISFGELLIVGVVALIVLGPERLPTVARTIGALVGRAQRFVASVKSDIHQHSQMAGFDDLKQDVQQAADAFRSQIESEVAGVRELSQQIGQTAQAVEQEAGELLDEAARQIAPPADPAGDSHGTPAALPTVMPDDNQLDLFEAAPSAAQPDNPVVKVRE
ncbi:Sec-independent protein translocase protein TatB [Vogesella indigofera]|uniref:Sec-independent protein translocase protein TatB n=1 Tax=Vogesella indigofera TaxID=45465 RepID=UPI00234D3672|nr:Sec-independent protein translocase protein TatB [Vogesella indigofera]MDC7705329.1 Sec-independent protein translocase protein TatB [Vogesella indigofera]MDC7709116.1 Sec-independent protein translocase protein TatB [Vogesella indigofera]